MFPVVWLLALSLAERLPCIPSGQPHSLFKHPQNKSDRKVYFWCIPGKLVTENQSFSEDVCTREEKNVLSLHWAWQWKQPPLATDNEAWKEHKLPPYKGRWGALLQHLQHSTYTANLSLELPPVRNEGDLVPCLFLPPAKIQRFRFPTSLVSPLNGQNCL